MTIIVSQVYKLITSEKIFQILFNLEDINKK